MNDPLAIVGALCLAVPVLIVLVVVARDAHRADVAIRAEVAAREQARR